MDEIDRQGKREKNKKAFVLNRRWQWVWEADSVGRTDVWTDTELRVFTADR